VLVTLEKVGVFGNEKEDGTKGSLVPQVKMGSRMRLSNLRNRRSAYCDWGQVRSGLGDGDATTYCFFVMLIIEPAAHPHSHCGAVDVRAICEVKGN
jgi:hypothetical protein